MKHVIAPKSVVEIHSHQAYFQLSLQRLQKPLYLIYQGDLFPTSKLHLATANVVAIHSLRSPGLDDALEEYSY